MAKGRIARYSKSRQVQLPQRCTCGRRCCNVTDVRLTAAIRRELNDEHDFHFIEATVPSEPAPGMTALSREGDEFFSWIDPLDPKCGEVARKGFEELDAYLECEGPFDGVMAFSQGAAIAGTYILHKTRQEPARQHMEPVFRCAIFLSGLPPADLDALDQGEWLPLRPEVGALITIPTANVWGRNDGSFPGCGSTLSAISTRASREVVVHGGAHEIPSLKDPAALKATVIAIRKTVQRALCRQ